MAKRLLITNAVAAALLLVVLLIGWWDAALFGLGVLVFMDLMIIVRERFGRSDHDREA